jgi:hypothetical protein
MGEALDDGGLSSLSSGSCRGTIWCHVPSDAGQPSVNLRMALAQDDWQALYRGLLSTSVQPRARGEIVERSRRADAFSRDRFPSTPTISSSPTEGESSLESRGPRRSIVLRKATAP